MQKNSLENSLPVPRNHQKPKWFHSVMMSMTMFTQSQNPSNFDTDLANIKVIRILTLS